MTKVKVKIEKREYDQDKINLLIKKAHQSINIIGYIVQGLRDRDIVVKEDCERSLVSYYRKAITKEQV